MYAVRIVEAVDVGVGIRLGIQSASEIPRSTGSGRYTGQKIADGLKVIGLGLLQFRSGQRHGRTVPACIVYALFEGHIRLARKGIRSQSRYGSRINEIMLETHIIPI